MDLPQDFVLHNLGFCPRVLSCISYRCCSVFCFADTRYSLATPAQPCARCTPSFFILFWAPVAFNTIRFSQSSSQNYIRHHYTPLQQTMHDARCFEVFWAIMTVLKKLRGTFYTSFATMQGVKHKGGGYAGVGLLQVHMKEREKGLVPPELYLLFLKLGSVTPPLWSIWEGVYTQACKVVADTHTWKRGRWAWYSLNHPHLGSCWFSTTTQMIVMAIRLPARTPGGCAIPSSCLLTIPIPLGRGSHCHFLINLSRYYTSVILCLLQLVHAGAHRQHVAVVCKQRSMDMVMCIYSWGNRVIAAFRLYL